MSEIKDLKDMNEMQLMWQLVEETGKFLRDAKRNQARLWEGTLECTAECIVTEECELQHEDDEPSVQYISIERILQRIEYIYRKLKRHVNYDYEGFIMGQSLDNENPAA